MVQFSYFFECTFRMRKFEHAKIYITHGLRTSASDHTKFQRIKKKKFSFVANHTKICTDENFPLYGSHTGYCLNTYTVGITAPYQCRELGTMINHFLLLLHLHFLTFLIP